MSQTKAYPTYVRWCFLPVVSILLAVFIFIESKNLIHSVQIRFSWIPTTAQITQTNRQGKGVLGEYKYVFQDTAYIGHLFGNPFTLSSKTGDKIQIWIDPTQPTKSDVPDSLLKIPFLFILLLGEAGCVWTILSRHPASLRK